jgi:hypothetical protein
MPPLVKYDHWLQTASHGQFFYHNPKDSSFTIVDIARSLAHQPRFLAHSSRPVSVAEHSLVVLEIVKRLVPDCDPFLALHALLHDAHEAFTGDIPSPFKAFLKRRWGIDVNDAQRQIQWGILQHFDIPTLTEEACGTITIADTYALKLERDALCNSEHPWNVDTVTVPRAIVDLANLYHKRTTIARVTTLFLARYRELVQEARRVDA